MNYYEDLKKLNSLSREDYFKVYDLLNSAVFYESYIPNVGDFALAAEQNTEALDRIRQITEFTNNTDDILTSANRRAVDYKEEESNKFMKSVIAANVTDITESGYFYKQLASSCDDMHIDTTVEDCGAIGKEIDLPIDENTYNFHVRNHYISELSNYSTNYDEFRQKTAKLSSIHVRTFLYCNRGHRTFCKRCAGIYQRSHNTTFIPKSIGIYSTLMITEHATQASLDSMNNGTSEKLNVALAQPIAAKDVQTTEDTRRTFNKIIDTIGNIGVESRFYEIALLSRLHEIDDKIVPSALVTSFLKSDDAFGKFIYRPSHKTLKQLVTIKDISHLSTKSKIALDIYEEENSDES